VQLTSTNSSIGLIYALKKFLITKKIIKFSKYILNSEINIFLNGTKVLSMWIKKLKQSIDTINNLDVHWDPVISKSTPNAKNKISFFL
jgi:hypothetical protein